MIRNKATKKQGLRRLAPFLAALGMLVMSSGAALMVTAGSASAATKVGICHATSSDSNPYVFISVDDDSAKFKGHLAHRNTPNKTWKNAGVFNGDPHLAGAPKRDLISDFVDDQGNPHTYDGVITAADCENAVPVIEAVADVDFEDPTCANLGVPSYDTTGQHVTFSIFSGAVAPATNVVIRATADPGTSFDGGGTTLDFPHLFGPAVDPAGPPCVIVAPPGVALASVDFVDPTCDNLNNVAYTPTGDNATFAITSGTVAPGALVEITATADALHEFAGGLLKKVFTHTFDPAVDLDAEPCAEVVVNPPTVDTPEITPTTTVATPTLVHAGLVSSASDLRGEQGLALLLTGMVLLVAAGALGLIRPGAKARG